MVALTGCGQRGPLYLPTDAAAKGRATLPDLLTPGSPSNGNSSATSEEPRSGPPASAESPRTPRPTESSQ
ncbi:putative lipoprotein [Burkholderiales bacterium 8X]|nr:putative lipoprotein [Burkholderiales bacterium 8X]